MKLLFQRAACTTKKIHPQGHFRPPAECDFDSGRIKINTGIALISIPAHFDFDSDGFDSEGRASDSDSTLILGF